MGQILSPPFDVQKLPGFRFGTLPPNYLTAGTPVKVKVNVDLYSASS